MTDRPSSVPTATLRTEPVCPLIGLPIGTPVAKSRTRTVRSSLPETITGRPFSLRLVSTESPTSCWRERFDALAPRQQDSVAPLLLTVLLRRARTQGNLRLVREALEVALAYDLTNGPAPS